MLLQKWNNTSGNITIWDKYNGDYIIESFDPKIVRWLRENAPEVYRGQLASDNIREVKNRVLKVLLGKMAFNPYTKPNFVSYQYLKVDKKFYNKHHKKNRTVAVWTVKSKAEYEKIKDYADIIIFENEETIS